MIQSIYIPTSNRLYFFISVAISGKGEIGIVFITVRVAAIIIALLRRLSPYFLYIFQFTAQDGILGNTINHFVLLPMSLHLLLPFMFGLLVLFNSLGPTSHGYY